jgi:hypothetical protein
MSGTSWTLAKTSRLPSVEEILATMKTEVFKVYLLLPVQLRILSEQSHGELHPPSTL